MSSYTGQNDLYTFYQAPTLSYSKVWSSADKYFTMPASASWAGGTATFIAQNHNLVTGDVVSVSSTKSDSAFIAASKTITVVDKNTFTCAYVADTGSYSYNDKVERLTISCEKYSKLMFRPAIVHIDTIPSGTTITVDTKVHPEAEWVTVGTFTNADGASQVMFSPVVNLVRCTRTVGSGQPVVYSQGA